MKYVTPIFEKTEIEAKDVLTASGDVEVVESNNGNSADYKIDFSKFNWTYHDDVLMFVGKDGGPGGADTFIGRILKQTFPNDPIEFVDDIAPVHVDGPVIDMTEIGKLFDR